MKDMKKIREIEEIRDVKEINGIVGGCRPKVVTLGPGGRGWEKLRPRSYFRNLDSSNSSTGETPVPVDVPRRQILLGDATRRLRELPEASIDCCITSPPYYMLRDYGVGGQIGLEATVDAWVDHLLAVFAELARVLKPSGSLWLNLGDSYSRHPRYGAPPKSLLLAPERLLLALAGSGWIVRNKVIWAKPNPMPSSVTDRLSTTYEVIYFLVRSPKYFFDLDAIRLPHSSRGKQAARTSFKGRPAWAGPLAGNNNGLHRARPADQPGHELGKNPGDVWSIPTRGFHGPHFATFPTGLVRGPLLATCPEAICNQCRKPWKRTVTVRRIPVGPAPKAEKPTDRNVMRFKDRWHTVRTVGELQPCTCNAGTKPGIVIDPFMGAGTTAVVAETLNRDWIGIEVNRKYRDMALGRIETARTTPKEVMKREQDNQGNERRAA